MMMFNKIGVINYNMSLEEIEKLVEPCTCKACSVGCMYGSGAMVENDIVNIADFLNISQDELKEKYLEKIKKFNTERFRPKILRRDSKPYGPCIFFKEGRCVVHPVKPIECRISMGCRPYGEELIQWFTAHYFVNPHDKESLREWEIVVNLNGTIEGAAPDEIVMNSTEKC